MSSFWSSIRGRKNSSSAGDSEGAKPPSGRSTISKNSRVAASVDEELQRQDSDEKSGKGCLKMSCLSGQGFPCKSLSSKLLKVQKSGSPTRKSSKYVDVPPTPVPTPEPETMTFSDLSTRPPIPDSPKPKLKLFRKRAASASPSRLQSEKRKMFRGLSKERLLAPLPAPIRNFLLQRQSQSKPDISIDDKSPIPPLRKPGPLGKSWIKVYSDIPYVDEETSEENFPFMGHSGYPVKLPEAIPLPKPPTPPPEKIKIYDIVLEDIKPQKEALIKEISQSSKIIDSEDSSPKLKEEIPIQFIVSTKNDNTDEKVFKQDELIENLWKFDSKVNEGIQNETDVSAKESSFNIDRPNRSRDIIRRKDRRAKRSGTPINADTFLRSPQEVAAVQTNSYTTSEEVLEDGYIIPQSVNPEKPPRDDSLYDKRSNPIENINTIDRKPSVEVHITEDTTSVSIIKHFDDNTVIPDRPKRGNKLYENIKTNPTFEYTDHEQSSIEYPDEKQHPSELQTNNSADNILNNECNLLTVEAPPKPRRKPKLYENLHTFTKSDEFSIKLPENIISDNINNMVETPPKPFRGHKIYNKAFRNKEIPLNDKESMKKSGIPSEVNLVNGNSYINNFENKENVDISKNITRKPPYATVRRDRLSKELREIAPYMEISDSPPPVPPKKKDIKSIEINSLPLSEKTASSRSLCTRTRSAETSPSRPKRKRLVAQIHMKTSPARPNRSTKVYTELQIVQGTNFKKCSESKINRNTSINVSMESHNASREFRQSCPLPAPPRPNKSPYQRKKQFQPLNDVKETKPSVLPPKTMQGKFNNSLIKSSSTRRNRPPPPPPPNLKGKPHATKCPSCSNNDTLCHQEAVIPIQSIPSLPVDNSSLNTDIDINLKNIENSFNTMNSVLHSITNNETLPSAWSHEITDRRLSCDVVCDDITEVYHSINQNKSIKTEISNIALTHNNTSDSQNQFIGLISREKNTQGPHENNKIQNENLFEKHSDTEQNVDFSYKEESHDLENTKSVEFKVSIPSIIPVADQYSPIAESSRKLSCHLNIEPIKSNLDDQIDNVEKIKETATNSAESETPLPQALDNFHTLDNQELDSTNEMFDNYEDEIKAISRELNVLRSTLERCDSEYSEDEPKESEKVVVGTLLLGSDIEPTESFISKDISELKEDNNKDYIEKIVICDNRETNIDSEINKNENLMSNTVPENDQCRMNIKEQILIPDKTQVSYSFQEHLQKNSMQSISSSHLDTNYPDTALAMERMLETISLKTGSSKKSDLLCEETEKENTNQINETSPKIYNQGLLDSCPISNAVNDSTKVLLVDIHVIDNENHSPDCHISNNDSTKDQEITEGDSSEDVSEASSCTVEELKIRSTFEREEHVEEHKKCIRKSDEFESNIKPVDNTAAVIMPEVEQLQEFYRDSTKTNYGQTESMSTIHPTIEVEQIKTSLQESPLTSELIHGVANITGKLEGIRSQLEAVISNYIPESGLSDSSLDYTSSESPSSMSNRSSLNLEEVDSTSNASFYSMSQPRLSNFSLLSYYTARSGGSPALSESPTNTPSTGSITAEDDDLTEPEL